MKSGKDLKFVHFLGFKGHSELPSNSENLSFLNYKKFDLQSCVSLELSSLILLAFLFSGVNIQLLLLELVFYFEVIIRL